MQPGCNVLKVVHKETTCATAIYPAGKGRRRTAKKATNNPAGAQLRDAGEAHAQHLCELVRQRKMAKVAGASKGAKYLCNIWGRAAAKADSLCDPIHM